MKKTTVYSIVVLTMLSLGLFLVPSAFSQTSNVKILSYTYYYDSQGGLIVVGEIQNVGPDIISSVRWKRLYYS
jgi:type IV secretory pathway TrbL component